MTARQSITELVNEGLLYREQGRGTWSETDAVALQLLQRVAAGGELRQRLLGLATVGPMHGLALAGFGVLKATAHTKFLNFASNLGGFAAFAAVGVVSWKIGLVMGAAQFLGARLGSGLAMKNGAKLICRPGQAAILVNEGKAADIFGPGTHTLSTQNVPILSTLRGWKSDWKVTGRARPITACPLQVLVFNSPPGPMPYRHPMPCTPNWTRLQSRCPMVSRLPIPMRQRPLLSCPSKRSSIR